MTATVTPRIIQHGMAPYWIDVESDSSIGSAHTSVGPIAIGNGSPQLVTAVGGAVRTLVQSAESVFGQAMTAHPELCSRCVRTLLRMALGNVDDANAVMAPRKPGDDQRYAAAWVVVGPQVQKIQSALRTISVQAAQGNVATPVLPAMTVGANVRDYYTRDGAPMHIGKAPKWEDYKLCECGDPTTDQPAQMMVGAVGEDLASKAVAAAVGSRHHTGYTGGCGCGCDCGCGDNST